jgi:hypothetical protein
MVMEWHAKMVTEHDEIAGDLDVETIRHFPQGKLFDTS